MEYALNLPVQRCCMKMTAKEKERVARILEVLKKQGCISSYQISGNVVESVIIDWTKGGLDRVLKELVDQLRPLGLRRADAGWLVMLLPRDRREKVLKLMFSKFRQSLRRWSQKLDDGEGRSFPC